MLTGADIKLYSDQDQLLFKAAKYFYQKHRDLKVFYQFEIILTRLVSSFRFI